jgi:Fe-S-cluster-containing dehydrogenase component
VTQLALVIDLDKCVGCHACAANCKAWNTGGKFGPLTDGEPYGREPLGVWFNRVQTYEVGAFPNTEVMYLPKSCMHCKNPACVEVCPTGASLKRGEDGVVLVNYDDCIGCKYCSWACPYGCREFDTFDGVMKKCTLCADRINDQNLPPEERKPACVLACPSHAREFGDIEDPNSEAFKRIARGNGYKLNPSAGTDPANHYLPKRRGKIDLDVDLFLAKKQAAVEMARKHAPDSEMFSEDLAQP